MSPARLVLARSTSATAVVSVPALPIVTDESSVSVPVVAPFPRYSWSPPDALPTTRLRWPEPLTSPSATEVVTAPTDPIGVPVLAKPCQTPDASPLLANSSSCAVLLGVAPVPLAPTTMSLKPVPLTLPVASAVAYGVFHEAAAVLAKPCHADGVTAAPLANVVVAAAVSVKVVGVSEEYASVCPPMLSVPLGSKPAVEVTWTVLVPDSSAAVSVVEGLPRLR